MLNGFPGVLAEHNFRTPSWNIVCNAGRVHPSGRHLLACVVDSASGHRGSATWWMYPDGQARFSFVQGNPASDVPALAYGKTWAWGGFRCSSARTGLTCRNRSGHGFFLSRERQRIF